MQQVTSAEAQSRFGQLLDMAQREPLAITRHGRTAGYVIGPADMEILLAVRGRRNRALQDWAQYVREFDEEHGAGGASEITAEEIAQEIKAARAESRAAQAAQTDKRV